MHGQVSLTIEFQEVTTNQYQQMFLDALQRFDRELTEDQLSVLNPVIEQARENAMEPVDLAENLDENWDEIF